MLFSDLWLGALSIITHQDDHYSQYLGYRRFRSGSIVVLSVVNEGCHFRGVKERAQKILHALKSGRR